MATDEEYLDNLLKSIADTEQPPRTMEDALKEVEGEESTPKEDEFPVSSDELADMLEEISLEAATPEIEESTDEESIDSQDLLELLGAEIKEKPAEVSEIEGVSGIEEVPEIEADLEIEEVPEVEEVPEIEEATPEIEESTEEDDLTKLLDDMDNVDDDLAEINGLLKKADKNESVEEDMLALLESVKDNQPEDLELDDEDNFDLFAEEDKLTEPDTTDAVEEETDGKKKRKSKRKNKKQEADEATGEEAVAEQKEKKPNIFTKFFTFLTREDDELGDDWDENAEIIKELDEEDKKNSKKKDKRKKKKGKADNQEGTESPENGETDEIEAADSKKKSKKDKPKKEKKEKKEKPPKEKKEKPVKVFSKKTIILLVALCATLVASIFALNTFLIEYSDKENARDAFWQGDYKTAYELLYDKHLNDSDILIYNRVKVVLKLERKLHAYTNNVKLGRELEALDSLLQGVACYAQLIQNDEYGAKEDLDALYSQICTILATEYEISPEDAAAINALDSFTYTKKLDSIITGTEFVMPGEEVVPEEPISPQDILPEEEEIIDIL